MGKAIILEDCDFSQLNLGQVTFVDDTELQSLDISGESSAIGEEKQYEVVYNPSYTTQRRVVWSIESGSQYATIDQNGLLTILQGADNDNVTIKVESLDVPTIFATKMINVTYQTLTDNTIEVTASQNQIVVNAQNNVASNITIQLTGDLITTIVLESGNDTIVTNIEPSENDRICNVSIIPSSDETYRYVLETPSIIIPRQQAANTYRIVGPKELYGDEYAGQFFILDETTMKKVVATNAEIIDSNQEKGTISWGIDSGSQYVSFKNINTTKGVVDVLNTAITQQTITIYATVNGIKITKNISVQYNITDYYVSSFADMQEIERVINNQTESTIALSKNPNSSYTPVDGNGLAGAHIRMTNDVDFNNSHVGIGKWYGDTSERNRWFEAFFDGGGFSMNNIGGVVEVYNAANLDFLCPLFRAINNVRISNLYINGTVSSNSNSRCGVLTGWGIGENTIERIYSKVTWYYTAGNSGVQTIALIGGTRDNYITSMNVSDVFDLNTYIEANDISQLAIRGLTTGNAGSYKRCACYSTMEHGSNQTAFGYCQNKDLSVLNSLAMPTFSMSADNAGLIRYGSSGGNSLLSEFENVWFVGVNSIVTQYDGRQSKVTNGYASVGQGAAMHNFIRVDITTLKDPSLEIGNQFIKHNGYYPIIDNQFAIESDVLTKHTA